MSSEIQHYVCGFLFTLDYQKILLIRKRRPRWQRGLLNGVGGKIENGEIPLQAMAREFHEEAGVRGLNWEPISILNGEGFAVHFFATFGPEIYHVTQQTDEPLETHRVEDIFNKTLDMVSNVPLMVALALDRSGIRKPVFFQDSRNQSD